jgi:CRP-like cAMP-binding protein
MDVVDSLERFARVLALDCEGRDGWRRLNQRLRPIARHLAIADGKAAPLGRSCDMLVFVAEGCAKLVAQTPGGREQVVAFHFAGDLIDVPSRSDHAYAVFATGGCEVLAFSRSDLLTAVRDEPAILEAVFSRIVDGLERCRENAVNLGRKSASERVASFLLTMARHGQRRPGGGLVIDLPMSRRDVSDCLGLTVETISRQISELRKDGLIATPCRSRVELLDAAELEVRANHFASAA